MTHTTTRVVAAMLGIALGASILIETTRVDAAEPNADTVPVILDQPIVAGLVYPWHVHHASFRPAHHRLVITFRNGARVRFAPCPEEDSPGCYWMARKRGNHIGHSFVHYHGYHYLPRFDS